MPTSVNRSPRCDRCAMPMASLLEQLRLNSILLITVSLMNTFQTVSYNRPIYTLEDITISFTAQCRMTHSSTTNTPLVSTAVSDTLINIADTATVTLQSDTHAPAPFQSHFSPTNPLIYHYQSTIGSFPPVPIQLQLIALDGIHP